MDSAAVANLVGKQSWRDDRASERHHLAEHLKLAAADGTTVATGTYHCSTASEPGPATVDCDGSTASSRVGSCSIAVVVDGWSLVTVE